MFSVKLDKKDEENQVLDGTELYINLNSTQNLKETDLDKINARFALEKQIQKQEMKNSGLRFDKINSMTKYFYKTGEMTGSNYLIFLLRSSAILNVAIIDKYCFICSVLAKLHPIFDRKSGHSTRVSNYIHNVFELNIQGFDFPIGFKCSDVHKFEILNNLFINIFEISFYQDQNTTRKHKLIPFEDSKNDLDRSFDLLFYRNHYVIIKRLNVFFGNHNCSFVCRRCLSSYTCQNM